MNYRMIKNITGWLLLFEALFLLVPSVTALIYMEKAGLYYVGTAVVCALIGWLCMHKKPADTVLYAREGFVIVSMSWIVLSLFGAVPLWLCGDVPDYIDALFEVVSGYTTTGASILAEVETLTHASLMWRSFTHWVGGMGVLVFIMAFVPLSGGQNMHIMKAESPGPSVSKLVPRVKTTALILYSLYLGLTMLMLVLLLCGGMTVFEALNTAFATAGTGGFGFRNDSMASFSSYLQIVITVFMLLFSIDFGCYYCVLRGKLKDALNAEVRTFLIIVFGAVTVITLNVRTLFPSIGEAIRHVFFTVASLISTTGFSTVDFDLWPSLSQSVLVLLMFVGACAGSTGGGIKVSRLIILFKGMVKELDSLAHPHRVRKVTVNRRPIDHEVIRSVNAYMIAYLLVFTLSVILLSIDKHDLVTNFTAVTATINNIGPGLSMVGPTCNFGFFSIPCKLILIFDMLAGRLELFPMLVLLAPTTWKK
ncbi:MAG: TrkH family potassium uptake protein [Clostridia bacterium]|nr:TrkH family potassium uptake protein [Clostridia bacterium]